MAVLTSYMSSGGEGVPAATPSMVAWVGSLVGGHRYLVIAGCFISGNSSQAYSGICYIGQTTVGNMIYGSEGRYNAPVNRFYCARYSFVGVLTAPMADPTFGLWVQCTSGAYAQYSQPKIVVIDLDSAPDSFPKESPAGWQYAENLTTVDPTPSPANHTSITFRPDGISNYLVLATSNFKGMTATGGQAIMSITKDGTPVATSSRTGVGTGNPSPHAYYNIVNMAVINSPPATTPITIGVAISDPSSYWTQVVASRLVILRLNSLMASAYQTSWGASVYMVAGGYGAVAQATLATAGGNMVLVLGHLNASPGSAATRWNTQLYASDFGSLVEAGLWSTGHRLETQSSTDWDPNFLCVTTPGTNNNVTYSLRAQSVTTSSVYARNASIVAIPLNGIFSFDDANLQSNIAIGATAVGRLTRNAGVQSSIAFGATAAPARTREVALQSTITVGATAFGQRIKQAAAAAAITIAATAASILGKVVRLGASVPRMFRGDQGPWVMKEEAVVGIDTAPTRNRLKVNSTVQLGIDPLFAGYSTPGRRYTFAGPANTSSDPIRLGFKAGDKIRLMQADGEPVGPNDYHSKGDFTIVNPDTLEVAETLVFPDSTKYKFHAIKRGT